MRNEQGHSTTGPSLGLLLAGLLALGACSAPTPPPPPPPEVDVITVTDQAVPYIVQLPGRVQAVRTAEVRARVDGIVQRRLYEEGSDVRAGQPLFSIDPRALRSSLNAVQATLARAQANAANAQQDVSRYQGLLEGQAISKQEYDAAVARLRSAQADVAQARAQVESARLSLSYTTVTAPIAGRAGRAQVTEGALVSASGGTLLTTIEQVGSVYINFSQSSSDLLAVRRELSSGQLTLPSLDRVPVSLQLEDGTTYGITGHIDFLDLAINEETGTAALRAEFANPGRVLLPGQFVRARIEAGTKAHGIMVPQRAVKVSAEGGTVMVVGERDLAEIRQVRLGALSGTNWIVMSGLKPGERVIVNGLQKVQPGKAVRVSKGAPKPAQPKPAASPAQAMVR